MHDRASVASLLATDLSDVNFCMLWSQIACVLSAACGQLTAVPDQDLPDSCNGANNLQHLHAKLVSIQAGVGFLKCLLAERQTAALRLCYD